jgi:hypothetical protein
MKNNRRLIRVAIAGGLLLLLAAAGLAQRGFRGGPPEFEADVTFPKEGEFHYLRLEYDDASGYRRGFGFVSRRGRANGWWAQDFPDAELHFTYGLSRLTRIDVAEPAHVGLTDETLFDYPWIYATQTGNWQLSDEEIGKLREFLMRGGFMMTDDTWDRQEQSNFEETMERVFPDRQITEMDEKDQIMHVLYDIQDKDRTYIPGSRHLDFNGGIRQFGAQPRWLAIRDDKARVMIAIDYDTDIADAWEFADAPFYPEHMTTLAYRYGINYLIYAMTH